MAEASLLSSLLSKNEAAILKDWTDEQFKSGSSKMSLISRNDLVEQSREFLRHFTAAAASADAENVDGPAWKGVRDWLSSLSRSRTLAGFTPTDTATFIFSLKQPVFTFLRRDLEARPQQLADEMWKSSILLDKLGLFTTEVTIKAREEVIQRQQEDMLELSTPVVKLWDGVLALPMIGTLDSARTQVVMETLLQRIVETNSEIAIIDITGVPTVDTLVAQHLIKTVTAARLMGAECIISGIRPQIAATIVHLGVDLAGVMTKASLADAFVLALARLGRSVSRSAGAVARA